ncbi:MAG: dehydrogenase [Rhodospirillales bacterium]|nr:dehydrogenase [Rhodospirillales bacterium]
MRQVFSRRVALLGSAGLLSGCETIEDFFGTSRRPLPGTRIPVLGQDERTRVSPDANFNAAITLPPPVARADWPQAGGTLSHAPGHVALGDNLTEAWRSGFGSGSGYRSRITGAPIVAGETVFVSDAYGVISAFATANGRRRWRFDSRRENERDGAVGAGIAFDNGVLFVSTGLAELIALDPADATVKWRIDLPAPARGGMTVAGGRVLVPTMDQLFGFSVEDGRRVWSHRSSAAATAPLGTPSPAVEGDVAVAGFASGEVVAIRVADGRVLWTESLAAAGRISLAEVSGIRALPVISEGRVVAVGMGGLSVAIDLRSGRRLWERELGGANAPYVVGEWVFAVTDAGEAAAVSRDDGRIRWVTGIAPAAAANRAPGLLAPPVLASGRLYVGTSGGELVALNPMDGTIVGRQRMPGGVTIQPAIAGDTMFVVTDDATLVALRPSA